MNLSEAADNTTASLDRKALLALVEASRWITQDPSLEEVLDRVTMQGSVVMDAEGSSVLLLDETRRELVFKTASGPAGKQLLGVRMSAEQGIAGQVLRTGRAVRVDDVRNNQNFFPGIDQQTTMQTRSLIAAPLIHRERPLGVVEVVNPRKRDTFNDDDLRLLEVFGNLAAAAMANALAYDRVQRDNRGFRESMRSPLIIGRAQPIQRVLELCRKVAPSKASVLVTGETGVGKELIARTIHDWSDRRDKPFIAVNCAALPETLLDSELFGHEKGAFTGAVERKLGRFELADGGTLFLDELGEMVQAVQVKLLRVLQEQQFVRVGGTDTLTCDVRVVAATNRELTGEIDAGRFRKDLYYRLNVFPIVVPQLRERIEDLPLLVDHFIAQVVPSLGVPPPKLNDAALRCLMQYSWPGNIRELRNVIERSTLLAGDEINVNDLPPEVAAAGRDEPNAPEPDDKTQGESKLAGHEKALILSALARSDWNQSAAARELGITRDHLRYRIKKYGLEKPAD